MLQTITTAIVLFIGVLLGFTLTTHGRKEGFESLLAALQKLKDSENKTPKKRLQAAYPAYCMTCGQEFADPDWERALEELNHHLRTKHPDKTNVVDFPAAKPRNRWCVVCSYAVKAEVQAEADAELLQHMKTYHPEHLLGSDKPVRELPNNGRE